MQLCVSACHDRLIQRKAGLLYRSAGCGARSRERNHILADIHFFAQHRPGSTKIKGFNTENGNNKIKLTVVALKASFLQSFTVSAEHTLPL